MKKILMMGLSVTMLWCLAGCGGGSSDSSGGGTGGGTGGTATVASLSSVPSMDLSSYDYSAQAASAEISAPILEKFVSVSKVTNLEGRALGDSFGAIGSPSRAGCEANMHSKEMKRMSQEAQLDRCYMEAMENGGLITIPSGSYNFYKITVPGPSDEDKQRMCGSIPEEDKRNACMSGNEGPKGGIMLARLGRFGDAGNELRIDMCEGPTSHEAKVNEATYTADGNTYTGTVIRKGTWNGKEEGMKFNMVVAASSVQYGIADLGTNGYATAEGWMSGGHGQGHLTFIADATDLSTRIRGAFKASFTDPFKGVEQNFTGKADAKFGGLTNTGSAKFSFSGTHPAMAISEMASGSNSMQGPEQTGIPSDQQAGFYQFLSQQLGVAINTGNAANIKVCPTPNGMSLAIGDTCEESKEGIESFSIANVEKRGDGYTSVEQTFAIILDSASAFYNDVKGVDLSAYDTDPGAIVFTRTDWNCEMPAAGWTLEIKPDELRAGNAPAGVTVDRASLEAAMTRCNALEEKLRESMGMGGYDCADRQMRGDAGEKFGGGTETGHSGTEGGMVPAPCSGASGPPKSPEECRIYCEAHQSECFSGGGTGGGTGSPPPNQEKPAYCVDHGLDMQQCGEYCQQHHSDCGF